MNMWSMMNLLETSLRVPLIIKPAAAAADGSVTTAGAAGAPPVSSSKHRTPPLRCMGPLLTEIYLCAACS
jgi:hypothetical protein